MNYFNTQFNWHEGEDKHGGVLFLKSSLTTLRELWIGLCRLCYVSFEKWGSSALISISILSLHFNLPSFHLRIKSPSFLINWGEIIALGSTEHIRNLWWLQRNCFSWNSKFLFKLLHFNRKQLERESYFLQLSTHFI